MKQQYRHNNKSLTKRDYQRLKRKQFREAAKALDVLRDGCAFLPNDAYQRLLHALEDFDAAQDLAAKWWRKA